MFPITYRHQFDYTVQGDERWIAGMLRAYLADSLKKKGAQRVAVVSHGITFGGRVFSIWTWNWHLFRSVSKGQVIVTCHDGQLSVTAELSFIGLALFALCASVFPLIVEPGFFGFGTSSTGELLGMWVGIVWLWMFGGNVFLTYFRFYGFMRNQLKQFIDSVASASIQGQQIASR